MSNKLLFKPFVSWPDRVHLGLNKVDAISNKLLNEITLRRDEHPQIRNLIGCSGTMPEKLQGSFSSTRSLYKRNVRRHKIPLPHKAA